MQPLQKITLSRTNCFLLKAADGYLLVDCGCAGDEQSLLVQLGRLGLSPLSIRSLLLTHHHSDHSGLLPFLLSANPRLNIVMSGKCAAYLERGRHCHPAEERYASKALGLVMGLYRLTGGKLTQALTPYVRRDGDVIAERDEDLPDFLGIPGRLLHTPGHTEDSLSLIVGKDAFVGDAARNLLNFLGSPYEPILYSDRSACRDSWAKLLARGITTIHPAHGPSFSAECLRKKG